MTFYFYFFYFFPRDRKGLFFLIYTPFVVLLLRVKDVVPMRQHILCVNQSGLIYVILRLNTVVFWRTIRSGT